MTSALPIQRNHRQMKWKNVYENIEKIGTSQRLVLRIEEIINLHKLLLFSIAEYWENSFKIVYSVIMRYYCDKVLIWRKIEIKISVDVDKNEFICISIIQRIEATKRNLRISSLDLCKCDRRHLQFGQSIGRPLWCNDWWHSGVRGHKQSRHWMWVSLLFCSLFCKTIFLLNGHVGQR